MQVTPLTTCIQLNVDYILQFSVVPQFVQIISGSMSISSVKPSEDIFNAWCLCLNPELRGTFKQSDEVDRITKNKIDKDFIYTPTEKKKIKPTSSCISMYDIDNHNAYVVCELLQGDYG